MPNTAYSPDAKPRLSILFALALQYVCTASSFLILTITVAKAANLSLTMTQSIISISMVLCGLSAILQAIKSRWFGAGLFAGATPNPAYLAPALLAVKTGGIGLLAGMMLFASVLQAVLAVCIKYLKSIFPPELGAMLISLIGCEVGTMGVTKLSAIANTAQHANAQIGIAIVVIILVTALYISNHRNLRTFGLLIGIIVGYSLSGLFGLINPAIKQAIHALPWLQMPHWPQLHYQFSTQLIIPFAISAIICTSKVMGSISALQQAQNTHLISQNTQQMSAAAFADSAINVFAGIFGCLGFNFSSSMMALSASNKIFCRRIAYPFALIFILLALCPKLSCIFVFIPNCVIAAVLIFLGATLLINGLSAINKTVKTLQMRVIISTSFMVGVSHLISPQQYQSLPTLAKQFTNSLLAIALILALVLIAFCHLHQRKKG